MQKLFLYFPWDSWEKDSRNIGSNQSSKLDKDIIHHYHYFPLYVGEEKEK